MITSIRLVNFKNFAAETTLDPEAVEKINELLAEVSAKLRLN